MAHTLAFMPFKGFSAMEPTAEDAFDINLLIRANHADDPVIDLADLRRFLAESGNVAIARLDDTNDTKKKPGKLVGIAGAVIEPHLVPKRVRARVVGMMIDPTLSVDTREQIVQNLMVMLKNDLCESGLDVKLILDVPVQPWADGLFASRPPDQVRRVCTWGNVD